MAIKFEQAKMFKVTPPEDMEIASITMSEDGEIPSIHLQKRRPNGDAKQLISLRLDPEVITLFKATGEGWQTRMNEALRKAAGL